MRALILAAAMLLATAPLGAATTSPSCTITSIAIAFGTYDVFSGTDRTTNGRIKISCSGSSSGTISMTASAGASGTYAARTLVSGSDTLRYNLFLDSTHQTVWGDGSGGSSAYTDAFGTVQVTIYGLIPAGQDAATGSYTDALITTINF